MVNGKPVNVHRQKNSPAVLNYKPKPLLGAWNNEMQLVVHYVATAQREACPAPVCSCQSKLI